MALSTKSVLVKKFGGYDSLVVAMNTLPPLNGLVEVKVHYSGLNFADLYMRQGLMKRPLPFVLGMECCGVVTDVGFETSEFKVGNKVICYNHEGGMYSEVVRVPPEQCYVIPEHVSFEDGAALFVNYLTAYFCLIDIGNLRPKQSIFIHSCGGGVGWAAMQLAQTVPDVKIYGTTSEFKKEILQNNGVHHVLSYNNLPTQINETCPEGFDLVLETQSGNQRCLLQKHLKPLGKMVLLGANMIISDTARISAKSLLKLWWMTKPISPTDLVVNNHIVAGLHLGLLAKREPVKVREVLHRLVELLGEGKIQPRIDSVWELQDVVEATKVLAERRNIGKVLLKVLQD